ncbi:MULTISPECIES: hypothetical protein [Bradyrhizobium]|uniref:Uncharacterized protein n=1 Tax=Bradyrhizobium elkanii TaxID=29448 RepID=A0A8I1Y6G6_BRAEL|nr:hypothetical protein [Bradyrhizobium elkanii]MBP1294130.1 hypothetical protein [Bradyrhizobium elkanii]
MNICSMNKATLERVIAALRVHHNDPRMGGGLAAKIKREEMPASLAGLFEVWPADEDGTYRLAVTDNGLALVWRAYAIAEIAAGRGRLASLDKHSECLGIVNFDPAFDYVCDQMRGRGVRPCSDACRQSWTDVTDWVVNDGVADEPRKRWAQSAWARRASAHRAYVAAGLARRGCDIWHPEATLLFVTPRPRATPVHETLSNEDEAALANLSVS